MQKPILRILAACAIWTLCIPALILSLSMSISGAADIVPSMLESADSLEKLMQRHQTGRFGLASIVAASVLLVCAWVALAVMTIAWIAKRRLARSWPVGGTACALAGLLALSVPFGAQGFIAMLFLSVFYASPGIAFAVFLCMFHLGRFETPAAKVSA